MNTELIGQSWDKLTDQHDVLVQTLCERLVKQYPNYEALFPKDVYRVMSKIVRTLTLVARVGDPEITQSRLVKLGYKHRQFNLTSSDFLNFKGLFLEVLGEYCNKHCPDVWNETCVLAWEEAFDKIIIPYMTQGLEKMSRSEKMGLIDMQTSAGNQLLGTVVSIKQETVYAEITLKLEAGDQIVAVVPQQGVNNLNLVIGSQAYVLIRSIHIMLVHADTELQFSTRNHFCGRVIKTESGAVNAKVTLQLKSGTVFHSLVTQDTITDLELKKGERVCCVFRGVDVILAVEKELG